MMMMMRRRWSIKLQIIPKRTLGMIWMPACFSLLKLLAIKSVAVLFYFLCLFCLAIYWLKF